MTAQHGPYLVRVERKVRLPEDRGDQLGRREVVSLEAVVDLQAARAAIDAYVDELPARGVPFDVATYNAAARIVGAGGSIDLPGGRITVEETTYAALWDELPSDARAPLVALWMSPRPDEAEQSKRELLTAWNERCGVKRQRS